MCAQLLLVGHLLLTINSSFNFLIYYLGNTRKVVQIFLRFFRKKRNVPERSPFTEPLSMGIEMSETAFSHPWTERRRIGRDISWKNRRQESEG